MAPISRQLSRPIRQALVRWMSRPRSRGGSASFAAAVVKLDRLGDFVLALAAIRAILRHYGEDRCLLVISPVAEELAATEFPSTTRWVLPHSLGHMRALKAAFLHRDMVSRCQVDKLICLRHQRWDYDELVLSWFLTSSCIRTEDGWTRRRAPEQRVFQCATPGEFCPVDRVLPSDGRGIRLCRELELHRQVLEEVLERPVADEEVVPAWARLEPVQGIVVSPLGSQGVRDFPPRLLRAAIGQAARSLKQSIVLIGQPHQRHRLEELAAYCRDQAGSIEVKSRCCLAEFLGTVGRACLVISADTATAHVAATFDRPAVIALGGGHYGQFGPWCRSSRQQWLTHSADCFWCDWTCRFPEPLCLTGIPEQAVVAAVEKAVASSQGQA